MTSPDVLFCLDHQKSGDLQYDIIYHIEKHKIDIFAKLESEDLWRFRLTKQKKGRNDYLIPKTFTFGHRSAN